MGSLIPPFLAARVRRPSSSRQPRCAPGRRGCSKTRKSPQLFQPVEIEGELYWDGGYASNPPLRPLIEAGAPADVILVHTSPMEQPEPPYGVADIRARTAEIAFNTPYARNCVHWQWHSGCQPMCPRRRRKRHWHI